MQQYKNILVPVDFSKVSGYALKRAYDLVKMVEAKLTVLHVIDYVPPPYAAVEIPSIYASEELMIERAREHLEGLLKELEIDDCDVVVTPGKTRKVILKAVEDKNIDLVVMGTHGETIIGFTLGSVANGIVQNATCDVMVVRSDPD
jgi:universal stress protein A